jgi:acetylornithine/N-succinyldiaminopimelate aminotransferase
MKPQLVTPRGLPRSYGEEFLYLESGKGVYLKDGAGNRYLDFGAGIAVNALGYGRRDLARIAGRQMRRVVHVSNLYATPAGTRLAAKLTAPEAAPSSEGYAAVHFGNSGAEANESALKFARLYAKRTRGEGHHKLASFAHAFHGRTMGALSVTPKEAAREPFAPLIPGTQTLPYNDVEALRELSPEFAAVIVEVVQGEGGLACMTKDFARALNHVCREHDIMLIADEVQTGLRRTGPLFAAEEVGLEPDIISMSKPLAGGLPLSATLIPEKINNVLKAGDHGTTFGGGPVTTAVAGAVWDIISDDDFGRRVAETADYFDRALRRLSADVEMIRGLRGRGMLRGLVLDPAGRDGPGDPERAAKAGAAAVKAVMQVARERGLLVLKSGDNVVRLAPPLVISKKEIDAGMAVLADVLEEVHRVSMEGPSGTKGET